MRIINGWEHQRWGDRIEWISWDKRKIYGVVAFNPTVGDEYRDRMDSGRIARLKIVKVERPGDPKDMFFASLEDIGYLDEKPERSITMHDHINEAIEPYRNRNDFDVLASAINGIIQANNAMLKRILALEQQREDHAQAHKEVMR